MGDGLKRAFAATKASRTNPWLEYTGELPRAKGLHVEPMEYNWVRGTYEGYTFEAKVYCEGSSFGINDGRVSKLMVKDIKGRVVFNYDRGMDIDAPIGYKIAAFFK